MLKFSNDPEPAKLDDERPKAPAVEYAFDIMEMLAAASQPFSLSEIAAHTGISPASCYRILNVLLERKVIVPDPRRKKSYSIGTRLFQMTSLFYHQQAIIPLFHSIAEVLKNEIHHSILLNIAIGQQMLVIAKVPSVIGEPFNTHVGQTCPIYLSAAGKAVMSLQPAWIQKNYRHEMIKSNPTPSFHPEPWQTELEQAKRLGYATSEQEFSPTVSALAAPVLNQRNEPLAALSVYFMDVPDIRHYAPPLIQAAWQLSSRLV